MRTFDLDQCADFLKVDKSVISKLAGDGSLPGAKIGKAWVFLEENIVSYLQTQTKLQMAQRSAAREVQDGLDRSLTTNAPTHTLTRAKRVSSRAAPPLMG